MTAPPGADEPLLLRVVAPHFVAGALWSRTPTGWRCTYAAPILRWMVGLDSQAMASRRKRLEAKGWSFAWIGGRKAK